MYAKAQKCFSVPPKDKSEFDISDGVYTCKDDKYLFVGEDGTKCYTNILLIADTREPGTANP